MHHFPILYVEDEEYDVLFLKQAFARAGIVNPLMIAVHGRDAIEYLAGTGRYGNRELYPLPGLILLDLNLPYQSGFEVLKWIRQQPGLKNILVLIYTSSDQPHDVSIAYELSANGYLMKTTDPDKLCSMVKALKEYWLVHNVPPRA